MCGPARSDLGSVLDASDVKPCVNR